MNVLRCETNGHPCGTDTWPVGWECKCASCQEWLASRRGRDFELKMATFSVIREARPDGGVRVHSAEFPGLILSSKDAEGIEADILFAAKALAEHGGVSVEGVFGTDNPDRFCLMYRQPLHWLGKST